MKTFIPAQIMDSIQTEFERVDNRLAETGREMALPMEVVLLQTPISDEDFRPENLGQLGACFILAFHTDLHTIAYIDEADNLIEIDYHAARTEESKR